MKYYSQIPIPVAAKIVLGAEMSQGLTKDAQVLDIKQFTAAQMKAATDALVATDKAFNVSRSTRQAAYAVFHTADDALTLWLGKATGVLSPFFGKRWNPLWIQVGFINPSIAIPSTISGRSALALRVISFVATNPGYEAVNQGVTAAAGTTLREAAVSTQNLASAADADLTNKGTARNDAIEALNSMMRMLIGLLSELMEADDSRWLDFGLSLPAMRGTPRAPAGLRIIAHPQQATGAGDGATVNALLTCDSTSNTDRYRFRMRIAGQPVPYDLVASATEPMATVPVPTDVTVEFIVQAVNGNRQSVPSDPISFTLVTPSAAKPTSTEANITAVHEPAIAGLDEVLISTNGNGHGTNGHSNGARSNSRV